jgi:hypothetical protein
MAGLRFLSPMPHPRCCHRQRTVRGQSNWLGFLCRTLSFPIPSRFYPGAFPDPFSSSTGPDDRTPSRFIPTISVSHRLLVSALPQRWVCSAGTTMDAPGSPKMDVPFQHLTRITPCQTGFEFRNTRTDIFPGPDTDHVIYSTKTLEKATQAVRNYYCGKAIEVEGG